MSITKILAIILGIIVLINTVIVYYNPSKKCLTEDKSNCKNIFAIFISSIFSIDREINENIQLVKENSSLKEAYRFKILFDFGFLLVFFIFLWWFAGIFKLSPLAQMLIFIALIGIYVGASAVVNNMFYQEVSYFPQGIIKLFKNFSLLL